LGTGFSNARVTGFAARSLSLDVRRDMSTLSYRFSPDNGLSFELLVDGAALGEVLADGNEGIPYWIVEDDLPYWTPHVGPRDLRAEFRSAVASLEVAELGRSAAFAR